MPRPPFVARPPTPTGPRTNHQIRAAQVRVIDAEGQQIGVMSLEDAIKRAEEAGLDLIEVAAAADPPVCRIADLGKFKFEQDKRARDSKKNQHISEVKEVRLRPRTDDHDLQVRVRAARRFLEDGHKVKVEVRFRGREATHPEVARDQINRIAQGVSDIAIVERAPSLEGRSMFAILARGRARGSEDGERRPAPVAQAAPTAVAVAPEAAAAPPAAPSAN
ncbi:MAG: translation initiation factor IF-3 [Chloroflexi bacterium]|nr:translation initiation factor IF-3 [Chloroflexota bacterium]MBV9132246.1 translation initiation factor IF-3 [Chloroflexota bacterium]MBV9895990.1 translation initiation factor IF-3 [Chloroflexota bacterium]